MHAAPPTDEEWSQVTTRLASAVGELEPGDEFVATIVQTTTPVPTTVTRTCRVEQVQQPTTAYEWYNETVVSATTDDGTDLRLRFAPAEDTSGDKQTTGRASVHRPVMQDPLGYVIDIDRQAPLVEDAGDAA